MEARGSATRPRQPQQSIVGGLLPSARRVKSRGALSTSRECSNRIIIIIYIMLTGRRERESSGRRKTDLFQAERARSVREGAAALPQDENVARGDGFAPQHGHGPRERPEGPAKLLFPIPLAAQVETPPSVSRV